MRKLIPSVLELTSEPIKKCPSKWLEVTIALLIFGSFLTLMISSRVSSTLQVLAVLFSVAVVIQCPKIDREELIYLGIICSLPLFYIFNMLIHGWEVSFLDRPFYLIWYFVIFLALRRINIDRTLLLIFIGGGLVLSIIIAMYERLVLEAPRVFGVYAGGDYGNMAGIYSAIAAIGLFLSFSMKVSRWSTIATLLAVLSCGSTIVIWSGSRTAFLIIGVAVLMGLLTCARRHLLRATVGTLAIFIALTIALMSVESSRQRIALGVTEVQGYFDPEQYESQRDTSIGLRLEMLRFGISIFNDSPLLGVGLPGYRERVQEAVNSDLIPAAIAGFSRGLHNQVLDHMVWGGIVGLISLMAFWVGLSWLALRWINLARDPIQSFFGMALLAVTLGYFIVGMFGSLFGSMHGTRTVALLWSTLAAFAAPYNLNKA